MSELEQENKGLKEKIKEAKQERDQTKVQNQQL